MTELNVQDIDAITLGNGVLELGGLNMGLLSGDVELTPTVEFYDFKAGVPRRLVKRFLLEEGATIKATMAELSAVNYAALNGNATLEIVAGTSGGTATITDEQIVLTGSKSTKLAHASATDILATAVSVKHVSGAPTYVLDTDYTLAVDDDSGCTLVTRKGVGIVTGATVKVTYTYDTPATAAGKRYHFGGNTTIDDQVMKFTHTRPDGRKVIVYFHKAILEAGMPLKFNEETVSLQDITLTAMADTTQLAGKELYYVEFED